MSWEPRAHVSPSRILYTTRVSLSLSPASIEQTVRRISAISTYASVRAHRELEVLKDSRNEEKKAAGLVGTSPESRYVHRDLYYLDGDRWRDEFGGILRFTWDGKIA